MIVPLLLALALPAVAGKPAKKPPAKPPAKIAAKSAPASEIARLGRGWNQFLDGDYPAATKELAPLASGRLANRDVALYLLAQSEALSGALGDSRAHFQAVAKLSGSRFSTVARARAADLAFELEKFSEAKIAYLAVLRAPSQSVETAVARFRIAEIDERAGNKELALAGYRKVFDDDPAHPLADRALAKMKELDPKLAIAPKERVDRARLLTTARRWQTALEELDLVPADAPADARREADYWIGTTHFKMRHGYDIAAQKLNAVAPLLDGDRRVEALFHGARAWSRADQDDKAIAGYRDLVARYPHARQAPEASFLIGWLDYNRGHYKEALPGLEETIKHYGGTTFGADARWYLGFSRWLSGDVPGALADFSEVAKRGGALEGGKGRYWKGRALWKLDRKAEAIAVWKQIVDEFPFSYYALSARARLVEAGSPVGPFGASPSGGHAPSFGAVDSTLGADPGVARADELARAGLNTLAGVELDLVDGPLIAKLGSSRVVPSLIDRYEKADDFFRVHRLAEAHSGGALKLDPHANPDTAAWWKHVYPLAYRPFVEKYAATGNNPSYYLYTIMLKESAYNPHDVSYADAIGLLQMIPPTSRRVSERIARPYTDDVLYDPEGNIQFGSWYIGHLLEKFKGQIPLGAGSYNAGPKAMMRWVKLHGDHPLDEFIELCAYTQTREYMKKVLDIYSRYLYLYEKADYLPAAKVDPKFIDNEIDY
jgi:soluble lytic murein transglycosylase